MHICCTLIAHSLRVALQNAVAGVVEEDESVLLRIIVSRNASLDLIAENFCESFEVYVFYYDYL